MARQLCGGRNQHKLIANPGKLGSVVAAMAPDLTRNGDVVRSQAALDVQNIHTAMSRARLHCSDAQAALIAWRIMSAATGGLGVGSFDGQQSRRANRRGGRGGNAAFDRGTLR